MTVERKLDEGMMENITKTIKKAYEVVINELKSELEPESIIPIRPHKTIREIVIEAEKEGLTYGKYVAKYHL